MGALLQVKCLTFLVQKEPPHSVDSIEAEELDDKAE